MAFFNPITYQSTLSPAKVKHCIDQLHFDGNKKRNWLWKAKTTLNWTTWNRFEVQQFHVSEIVSIQGKLENLDHENTKIHLGAKFVISRLLINVTIFVCAAFTLSLLSSLMLFENSTIGFIGWGLTLLLSTGLYVNLIGFPKKKYRRLRLAILQSIKHAEEGA